MLVVSRDERPRRKRVQKPRPTVTKPCADCGRPFTAKPFAKWGPCCRWKHRGRVPAKYPFTPERDALLRDQYNSSVRGRAGELARKLGVPRWIVLRRAAELGLCRPRDSFNTWTEAEMAFLETHVGVRHVHWIATQLKRSRTSVIMKLKHLHVSRRVREGYTLRDLELALGMDHRRIEQLVSVGKLRARTRGNVHGEAWRFTDDDVLDFMRRHPTAFRLDRVDQLWFLDLVFQGRVGEASGTRRSAAGEAA